MRRMLSFRLVKEQNKTDVVPEDWRRTKMRRILSFRLPFKLTLERLDVGLHADT